MSKPDNLPPYKRVSGNSWSKVVECPSCLQQREVRKDSKSVTCKTCAAKKSGAAGLASLRAKTVMSKCNGCSKLVAARFGYSYCSVACRMADKRVSRECKCCAATFSVLRSAIGENTNASGNFCSRACYEKWMCNSDKVTGRGSQWRKIRAATIERQPFCSLCGTGKNLQVHHIVPFRLTQDNSDANLTPLCVKHHKIVETVTHDVEFSGSSHDDMRLILGSMLAERAAATAMHLKELRAA